MRHQIGCCTVSPLFLFAENVNNVEERWKDERYLHSDEERFEVGVTAFLIDGDADCGFLKLILVIIVDYHQLYNGCHYRQHAHLNHKAFHLFSIVTQLSVHAESIKRNTNHAGMIKERFEIIAVVAVV